MHVIICLMMCMIISIWAYAYGHMHNTMHMSKSTITCMIICIIIRLIICMIICMITCIWSYAYDHMHNSMHTSNEGCSPSDDIHRQRPWWYISRGREPQSPSSFFSLFTVQPNPALSSNARQVDNCRRPKPPPQDRGREDQMAIYWGANGNVLQKQK